VWFALRRTETAAPRGGIPSCHALRTSTTHLMLRGIILEQADQTRTIWAQWDELAALTGRPYCSPAWMMSWWQHAAPPGALLRIMPVFEGEDLVGIAPLFADRGFAGVSRYRLLAAGTSAPLDILARPGMERTVCPLIARSLAQAEPAPDVIMLEGLPGDSPWARLLCDVWPGRGTLKLRRQFSQAEPFVKLSGSTYDEWFASKPSTYRRYLRRDLRAMNEHGATLRVSRSPEELTRDLKALAELHHARWRKRGGSGVLDTRVEHMLAEAGGHLFRQGRFRLFSVELDGRTISAALFVAAGGEAAYWLGGFDERETRVRHPGIMTLRYALEQSFSTGDRGLSLGPGGQRYKHELTSAARSVEWVLLIPSGLRSFLARAQLAPLRTRIVLAQRVSPEAKRVVRRLLEWRPTRRSRTGDAAD